MNVFRRVYLQIAAILIFSTLVLLGLIGGLVYAGLSIQLQKDAENSLQSEVIEVEAAVRSLSVLPARSLVHLEFTDDKGQSVFFLVLHQGTVTLTSSNLPVPLASLPGVNQDGFAVFTYQGNRYRMIRQNWTYDGHRYQLYVYRLALQEFSALAHARDVLIAVGVLGLIFATAFDMWLAYRALEPARKTWAEHQQMMAELSHELQTPLATMNAILAGNTLHQGIQQELQREISQASDIVQDILYLSRLRAVPKPIGEPIAVSDITEEVADRFTTLARRRNIELSGMADPGLFVQTTPDAWSRLISTLLKNVVDHAAPDTVAVWRLAATPGQVQLTIQNTGSVVAPSIVLPQDNQRLVRGLGLHIATRLTEHMGGSFRIHAAGKQIVTEVIVPRLTT